MKVTKEIKCKVCNEKPLMIIEAETQEELDKEVKILEDFIGETPCSNCMNPLNYLRFLTEKKGKKNDIN